MPRLKLGYSGNVYTLIALVVATLIVCMSEFQSFGSEYEDDILILTEKLTPYKQELEDATEELKHITFETEKIKKSLDQISTTDQVLELKKQLENWNETLSSLNKLTDRNPFPDIKEEITLLQKSFSPQNAPPSQRKQLQKTIELLAPVLDGYEWGQKLHTKLIEGQPKALEDLKVLKKELSELDKKLQMEASAYHNILIEMEDGSIAHFTKKVEVNSDAFASLEVRAKPSGVKIQIARQEAYAPAIFNNLPSEQELRLTAIKEGYKTRSQMIKLDPGENRVLPIIEMKRDTGSVSIHSNPIGASYKLRYKDSEYFLRSGTTPTLEQDLPTGIYTLTLQYKNWPIIKKEVLVSSYEQKISEQFVVSVLHISSRPSGAKVLMDGDLKGTTPLTIENIAPGRIQLELQKTGYEQINKKVVIVDSPTSHLEFDLIKSNTPTSGFPYEAKVKDAVIKMLYIKHGEFQMGAIDGSPSEKPVHSVSITKDFWMSETEITQKQWTAVMGSNPSVFKNENRPVENVSWSDAVEFCKRLNALEQKNNKLPENYGYSLPTEAQWEYGCRSNSSSSWAGDVEQLAWYKGNSNGKSAEVAQKKPNDWGFFDMHGNVWEWCSDKYDSNYYENFTKNDPQGSKFGSSRVIRGGGWNHDKWYSRSAFRKGAAPKNAYNYIGFRVALTPKVVN